MSYKISELADKAGITKRTIHYYISKGLLLPPEGTGVNSLYNDKHLERLNLIKSLQAQYMPLEKIREHIVNNPNSLIKKHVDGFENSEKVMSKNYADIYVKENVCDIFEIHVSLENKEKYEYIIENVKDYVRKMMGD